MGLNAASQDKLCVLGQVCYQVNPDSCILKKKCFNTIFRGYTPFTVTTNYWLYSPLYKASLGPSYARYFVPPPPPHLSLCFFISH